MAEPLLSSSADDFGLTRALFFSFSSDSTLLDGHFVEGGERMASSPPRYRQYHDLAFFFHQPLVEFSAAASSPFSCLQFCSSHYSHSTPAFLLNSFAEAGVFQRLSGAGVTKAEGVGDDGVEPTKTPSPSIPISFPAGDSSSRGELLCMLLQARPPHARVGMARQQG